MSDLVPIFAELFRGRTDALGLDKGAVRKREVTREDYARHLDGHTAIGIFPMLDSAHVWFGAIDLDEPDFALAQLMQKLIPGTSWIERSRSGNAHVWVFFGRPTPAWAVRAVLRGATEGVGRRDVEIFPKQDSLKPGMVGNYINLPWFGDERPFVLVQDNEVEPRAKALSLGSAYAERQGPTSWVTRARTMGAKPPEEREAAREFGTSKYLHECASYIIEHRESNPLTRGHRHQVLWHLAKMLLNWRELSASEARDWVDQVNQAGEAPLPEVEIDRLFENAQRGQWTSYGCDDPVMAPYVDPECPIFKGER